MRGPCGRPPRPVTWARPGRTTRRAPPRSRAMTAGPRDRLASVIVPCRGPLDGTRRCVAALARHTRPPWHLVAVIGAGDDATAGYLAGVADAAPFAVTVAAAPGPIGDAEAHRVGLAAARGAFVVLLAGDA